MKLLDNIYFRLRFAIRKHYSRFKETRLYRKLVELWELGAIHNPSAPDKK